MTTLIGIVLTMLGDCEALLAKYNTPLAEAALHDVHNARLNVETLARVMGPEHSVHCIGERGGWEA